MSPGASTRGRRIRGPLVQGDWLETKATSDTILRRMIWNVLAKSQFSIFLIDVRKLVRAAKKYQRFVVEVNKVPSQPNGLSLS
ncbi:hypothetical protein M6B38_180465 [Iris pallida]|uniref:Uncharacterized protein n=1 Tax=Iris pallida TaxID=29817 RepID=A0AAX6EMZ6_IRIPA|nr:hypothetical protein M6B38_180465 [Iris pallida]